jgi:hypothetical protein
MYEKEVEIEPIQHVQKEHDFNGWHAWQINQCV